MSEPKRYGIDPKYCSIEEFEDGQYVSYEDYARLKAEVERLKAEPDALTAYLYADTLRRDDIKTLKAQIERLTKAGDAMKFDCLNYLRELEKRPFWFPLLSELEVNHKSVQEWNAAKEGKQP